MYISQWKFLQLLKQLHIYPPSTGDLNAFFKEFSSLHILYVFYLPISLPLIPLSNSLIMVPL